MAHNILILHRGGLQVRGAIRGTEACLLALLRNIDRTRFNPLILCNDEIHLEAFRASGADAQLFDFPEIVLDRGLTHLPLAKYFGAMYRLDKIMTEKAISLLYCSGGLPCQISVPVAKLRRIPLICHFHHPVSKRYYYSWLVKFSSLVIFPSQYTKEHSLQKAGVDGVVVGNGINCSTEFLPAEARDLAWRRNNGIQSDDVVVAQVGAFSPNKRHDLLIAAFNIALQRMENLKLVLIGDGPERKKAEQLASDFRLQNNVVFAGYVPRVAEFFQNTIDINVLASEEEGLGLTLLEASACGLPNIGTDCTGIREAICDGETGYLFERGDADALAMRIVELAMDPCKRQSMGRAGRRYVETNFSETRYAADIMGRIGELLAGQ